jgi:glycosyltransferase involved in cell wall biosynthesis
MKEDGFIPVISIPILNRYDLLDASLNAVDFPVGEILIINNGTEIYQPKRKDLSVRVLNLPSNLGISASWNLAIKLYPHESFWVFASADTIWRPGGLEKLFNTSGKSRLVTTHRGFCVFSLGEDLVRGVGLFDECFYPYLFEDSDYAERVRIHNKNNNAEMMDLDDVFDKTIGDGTTVSSDSKIKEKYVETSKKNKNYFDLKASQNFQKTGEWNIDVRRSQEWL